MDLIHQLRNQSFLSKISRISSSLDVGSSSRNKKYKCFFNLFEYLMKNCLKYAYLKYIIAKR